MVNKKILVISVGGSHEPIIKSIDNINPDAVYFLCSQKSSDEIKKIQ